MLDRLTDQTRRAVMLAQEGARLLRHPAVEAEHLLLGLTMEPAGAAATTLREAGITYETLLARLRGVMGEGSAQPPGQPELAASARQVVDGASRQALIAGAEAASTAHVLLALLADPTPRFAGLLETFRVETGDLADRARRGARGEGGHQETFTPAEASAPPAGAVQPGDPGTRHTVVQDEAGGEDLPRPATGTMHDRQHEPGTVHDPQHEPGTVHDPQQDPGTGHDPLGERWRVLDRLDRTAWEGLAAARRIATRHGAHCVDTAHLLAGMAAQGGVAEVLIGAGARPDLDLLAEVDPAPRPAQTSGPGRLPLSPLVRAALDGAEGLAAPEAAITARDVVGALLRDDGTQATRLLRGSGARVDEVVLRLGAQPPAGSTEG